MVAVHTPPAQIASALARKLEFVDVYAPYAKHCDWVPGGYRCWIKQHGSGATQDLKVLFVVRVQNGKIVKIVQTGMVK